MTWNISREEKRSKDGALGTKTFRSWKDEEELKKATED